MRDPQNPLPRERPSYESLTIVVPVFNEAATIRASLERLLKVQLPLSTEILIVDDGSTDGSLEMIADLQSHDIRTIRHEQNKGKGAAVRSGIDAASGDLLTVFDADLEYDPSDYPALLRPIIEGRATVTYGTRSFGAHTSYSFWYVIGNRFVTFVASLLFNSWLSDIETCFKAAETRVWRELGLTSRGFGIEPEVTAKFLKAGHRIYEVPIQYEARSREEGKKLGWKDGVAALWILVIVRLTGRASLMPIRRGRR